MFILNYYGDEVTNQIFSTHEKALEYVTKQLQDCTDDFNPERQVVDRYADIELQKEFDIERCFSYRPEIVTMILDQDGGDYRLYTIETITIDPKYQPI